MDQDDLKRGGLFTVLACQTESASHQESTGLVVGTLMALRMSLLAV